jgi:hypothetical protein
MIFPMLAQLARYRGAADIVTPFQAERNSVARKMPAQEMITRSTQDRLKPGCVTWRMRAMAAAGQACPWFCSLKRTKNTEFPAGLANGVAHAPRLNADGQSRRTTEFRRNVRRYTDAEGGRVQLLLGGPA